MLGKYLPTFCCTVILHIFDNTSLGVNVSKSCTVIYMFSISLDFFSAFVCFFSFFSQVWFRVKHHVRDPKQQLEKKKLVAFWLEHYAKRDHGKPLTVVFDMSETGISHIVSIVFFRLLSALHLCP